MTTVLHLTAEQAAIVSHTTSCGRRLQPVPAKDGMFFLGLRVLEEPAFAEHHALLDGLPRVEHGAVRLPEEEEEEEENL